MELSSQGNYVRRKVRASCDLEKLFSGDGVRNLIPATYDAMPATYDATYGIWRETREVRNGTASLGRRIKRERHESHA